MASRSDGVKQRRGQRRTGWLLSANRDRSPVLPAFDLTHWLAQRRFARGLESASSAWLGRPFSRKAARRLLIYYTPSRIPFTQVYPFFHYRRDLARLLGLEVRALPVEKLYEGHDGMGADVILLEPWYDVDHGVLGRAIDRLRASRPSTRVIFLDSFAHNDLRLAKLLDGRVSAYLKKSVFADPAEFLRARSGHTNVAEYYGKLYGIDQETVRHDIPGGFLSRVHLSPGFLTAPQFVAGFVSGPEPTFDDRPIDLHSRIATNGLPWYKAMRVGAEDAVSALEGVKCTSPGRVPLNLFLDELRKSKLCWSPFGYGELCWRDIEAFLTGAVLIKPDMSHLRTEPDLFRPGETYLPVRWDYSDFAEVVHGALADDGLRRRVAENAFRMCRDYLRGDAFAQHYSRILEAEGFAEQAQTGT